MNDEREPEVRLFAAVIVMHIYDAIKPIPNAPSLQQEAIDWLKTKDFEYTCALGSLDPDNMRKIVSEINAMPEGREKVKKIRAIYKLREES